MLRKDKQERGRLSDPYSPKKTEHLSEELIVKESNLKANQL